MRAAVLTTPGEPLDLVNIADPSPAPGEVVVSVDACGICGSDLHTAEHLPLGGLVMGHEFCGTVVETTRDCGTWQPGDRIVGLSLATCGTCQACRDGRIRKCQQAQMIGFDRPGAYAEYIALPHTSLLHLPDHLDHRHGALVEPLAVARHAVERAHIAAGDAVCVLGAGPVGLAVALWLLDAGAGPVVVTDPSPARRNTALSMGVTAAIDPTEVDVAAAVADSCGGPPRRVIECVGIAGMLQSATEVAAIDAVVAVAGVCMTHEEVFPLVAMTKELDLHFAFFYRRQDAVATLSALANGRIDATSLVTGEVSLEQMPERFEGMKRPGVDAKVLVRPRQDSNLRPSA